MSSVTSGEQRQKLTISSGIVCLLGSVVLVGGGIALFAAVSPQRIDLVSLQWAGSANAVKTIVGQRSGAYRLGLYWDFMLIGTYTGGIVLACHLGRRVFWTPGLYFFAWIGYVAVTVAALANLAQDGLLLVGLHLMKGTWVFRIAASFSFLKFSALFVAALVATCAVLTTVGRLLTQFSVRTKWNDAKRKAIKRDAERPLVVPPPRIEWKPPKRPGRPTALDESIDRSWWTLEGRGVPPTHFVQDACVPAVDTESGTGICVSGGGIRSASVTLGALQALSEARTAKLGGIDHIVSVSGGGYMAGGFQLALTDKGGVNAGSDGAQASDVFSPGSPEEDHLRRHSSYLSDGPRQWLVALGVLLRNLLAGLLVIGLGVAALGLALGRFYDDVPIVKGGLGSLPTKILAAPKTQAPGFPSIPWAVTLSLIYLVALAALVYLAQLVDRGVTGKRRPSIAHVGAGSAAALLWVALIGVGIPAVVWASSWVTWHLAISTTPVAGAGGATVFVSYVGLLVATLWRNKQYLSKVRGYVGKGETAVSGVLPSSMVQVLIMWVALLVLTLLALVLCGWVATSTLDDSWWALMVAGPILVLWFFLDQTAMSLHPFYRRRLASAFAVRRTHIDRTSVAAPYRHDEETPLFEYGAKRPQFPQVTFATAANLTGQDRTPPGRRCVAYSLGSDYVGGPQVGWIRTDFLQDIVGNVIKHDLSVESAVAISGAAFASAMGAQTRFYEVFLALTNARLGAWLPNPYFVALKNAHADDWTVPGLPRIRRLLYYAREIFGIHPSTSRLLLCTDGGHYDNLGLVELLRRGCSNIYCFDASGASSPLADTLSGAIKLAREELGIEIELKGPYQLVPGSSDGLEPKSQLSKLNSRLSGCSVITGRIRYPSSNRPEGVLIFAQADLTADMPYELLEFTQDDAGFPNDGTADQWFDVDRFDAYQQLGRALGTRAAETASEIEQLASLGANPG